MLASRSAATAQERFALLNCRRLPGRLNTSETALLLGFQEHDIAPLIAAKLLVPLGKPASNSPKYFPAVEIAEGAASWNEDEIFQPYDETNLDQKTAGKYCHRDKDGRLYRLDSLINPNPNRPNLILSADAARPFTLRKNLGVGGSGLM